MKTILLTNGQRCAVDDADFDALNAFRWNPHTTGRATYAARWTATGIAYMHRVITDAPRGMVVDHLDGDGLNNSRANLRVCTHRENMQNVRSKRGGSTSRFLGVFRTGSAWSAGIKVDERQAHLGVFDTEEDAALAYDIAARAGRYVCKINFPDVGHTPALVAALEGRRRKSRRAQSLGPGVSFCKRTQRWAARCLIRGHSYWLGRHPTREAAEGVVAAKRQEAGF